MGPPPRLARPAPGGGILGDVQPVRHHGRDSAALARLAEVLARAFLADPAFSAIWPAAEARARALRRIERCNLRLHLRRGEVWTLGEPPVAVALWRPPGTRVGVLDELVAGFGLVPLVAGIGATRRLAEQGRATEACIAVEPGRWYLDSLAVDPDHQGRGLGRRLLRAGLARARTGVGLVTTNPRNLAFYEAHGFAIRGRHRLGEATLWHLVHPGPAAGELGAAARRLGRAYSSSS